MVHLKHGQRIWYVQKLLLLKLLVHERKEPELNKLLFVLTDIIL